jgi:hypothetical protein
MIKLYIGGIMQKIDLNGIKVVIFDFDDTLAIHRDKDFDIHRNESEDKRLGYYLNAYQNQDSFYDEIEPCDKSEIVYTFINELRKKNTKIYCLSGMKFSFHFNAKQNFINKYYGNDIELISVGNQKLKLDGIKIIQRINNCELNEILFVEDLEDTIDYLRSNGINVINVNDLKQ